MTGIHWGAVLHVLGTHRPRGRLGCSLSHLWFQLCHPHPEGLSQPRAQPCPALPCTVCSRSPHPRLPLFLEPFLLGSPSHPGALETVHIPIIPQPPTPALSLLQKGCWAWGPPRSAG